MNGDLGACFGRKKPNIDSLKYGKFAQKAISAMTIQLAEAEFT
jgi:acetolactate synthase small subunit